MHRGKHISVASVYVESLYRGKGYASTMLTLLQQLARKSGNYTFSDLYSDVKPTIYSRLGWKEYPAPSVAVHVKNFHNSSHFSEEPAPFFGLQEAARVYTLFLSFSFHTFLYYPKICKIDEEHTKKEVQERAIIHASSNSTKSVVVSHIPSH